MSSIDFTPDIIIGHWASPQMELIAKLKSVYDCPTAVVLHGTEYINNSRYHVQRYLKNIDVIGTRSQYMSQSIQQMLGLKKKPFVCYSGVPDEYLESYKKNLGKFLNTEKIAKSVEALQDKLKTQPIKSLEKVETKKNNIIEIHNLFEDFEEAIKSNNLFQNIKHGEKNNKEEYEKIYNLFEQLLFIFEKEKCNEITSDALIFMRSNFPADLDCKKETIKILHELYYLYYNIYNYKAKFII